MGGCVLGGEKNNQVTRCQGEGDDPKVKARPTKIPERYLQPLSDSRLLPSPQWDPCAGQSSRFSGLRLSSIPVSTVQIFRLYFFGSGDCSHHPKEYGNARREVTVWMDDSCCEQESNVC